MKNFRVKILDSKENLSLDNINNVFLKNINISWSFKQLNPEIEPTKLTSILADATDGIIIKQSKLPYPLPEELFVLNIIENPKWKLNPQVLICLKENHHFNHYLNINDARTKYGKVYIAGFGPGDPELLTIKTNKLLKLADVIYYDDLLDASYLDPFKADKIYVGKRKGKHSTKQENINELLYLSAIEGKQVVRLKGGDPLVFGRGGEEYHYLKRRFIDVEIIPGITAALSAAADGIIPLTSRGISTSVAFALGHDALHNKLPKAETLVFYMAASQQKKWAKRLLKEGWSANTPVAAIRNASLSNKELKRYTLEELTNAKNPLPAPCIVIIGHTASTNIKAQGRKWLYTGSDVNDFKGNGKVIHNPMIAFESIKSDKNLKQTLLNLSDFHRILFPTPIAVYHFFKSLFSVGLDTRSLSSIQLSSMGASTSTVLNNYGLIVKPETTDNSSDSLIKKFKLNGIINERILIPCSSSGLDLLPKGLRLINNRVETIAFYRNELPDNAVKHNLEEFYGVVFTSPTTVKNFYKVYGSIPSHLQVRTKGNYTLALVNKLKKLNEKQHWQQF